jgi:hypothetical protein
VEGGVGVVRVDHDADEVEDFRLLQFPLVGEFHRHPGEPDRRQVKRLARVGGKGAVSAGPLPKGEKANITGQVRPVSKSAGRYRA